MAKIPAWRFMLYLLLLAAPAFIYQIGENAEIVEDYEHPEENGKITQGETDLAKDIATTSNWYTTWAGGLLGFAVVILGAPQFQKLEKYRYILLPLFLGYGCFVASIFAGEAFRGRLTYLRLKQQILCDSSLNDHLILQGDLLKGGFF